MPLPIATSEFVSRNNWEYLHNSTDYMMFTGQYALARWLVDGEVNPYNGPGSNPVVMSTTQYSTVCNWERKGQFVVLTHIEDEGIYGWRVEGFTDLPALSACAMHISNSVRDCSLREFLDSNSYQSALDELVPA